MVDIIQVGWNSKHAGTLATQASWSKMKPKPGQAQSRETHTSSKGLSPGGHLQNQCIMSKDTANSLLIQADTANRRMNLRTGHGHEGIDL